MQECGSDLLGPLGRAQALEATVQAGIYPLSDLWSQFHID